MPDGDDYARFGNNTLQCHVFCLLKHALLLQLASFAAK
ncbi:hypothetical protein EC08BKT55439_1989 [Escherichia coli 08BKT055439]|nr:hypothetical protein ECH74115_2301 [Escherichia coli O157:H7 str. EC4115]AIG68716.1 hypothetical protein EDL933_2542 [Escherichia coli O157:H7 str. EDL933]AJA26122.1 hypothetical protein SS52_2252 [Escherichia coli O157:H7 str. SS52]EDU84593.1 hypothetical protein ECH7EC4501_0409 [Escherichia coli O157:H7 str. EC4501]EDZ79779.1 hypothetical protein ECH7EC4045_A3837 [Escherichia coli O157:H7 str. EC4045]EEC26390.1 hypothetical protein ESCCO14588_3792 [Escherichia coli O157:H7 str. TW14588]E